MRMLTAAAIVISSLFVVAPTVRAMLPHCGPDQIEMHFHATIFHNSTVLKGLGRFHFDRRDSNLAVLNFTLSGPEFQGAAVLSVWDMSTNVTYELAASSGACAVESHECNQSFSHKGSVRLGYGSEQLAVNIFDADADDESVAVVATKDLCIPLEISSFHDGTYISMSFYDARLGIQNPKVMRIPDECKTQSRKRRMAPVRLYHGF